MSIPEHVREALALVRRAFPAGVGDADYPPLLVVLSQHMCDENVAIVASELTGRDVGIALNDVYAAQERSASIDIKGVVRVLEDAGLAEWLSKDE